jgi:2-dehydro-3-deoxygluconokinase
VDALFGSREDFSVALGLSEPQRKNISPQESFNHVVEATCGLFPNIKMIAMTHRTIHSASTHSWQGFLWSADQTAASRVYDHLQVFDRVGSGDSFVAGVIHGLLNGQSPQATVDQGAAHGALAMTTAGDSSAVNHQEIFRLVQGEVPRILR